MNRKSLIVTIGFLLSLSLGAHGKDNVGVTQPGILWNINDSGFFDVTNKVYAIDNSRVNVDLRTDSPICPTGLGHLASGRDKAKEIIFTFNSPSASDY